MPPGLIPRPQAQGPTWADGPFVRCSGHGSRYAIFDPQLLGLIRSDPKGQLVS